MHRRKLLLIFVLFFLLGCAVVPITGRKQFSLFSQTDLFSLGANSYKQVLQESDLSTDVDEIEWVKKIGTNLSQAAKNFMLENNMEEEAKNYEWEFNVIKDDKEINAFCLPGGKIAVYTGILPLAQDDGGLATVLSHEIAHAIANHAGERISQTLLIELGDAALSKGSSQTLRTVYGIGSNIGVLLPYSRLQEKEADHIGLVLLAMAGYDPNLALSFWERMKEKGNKFQIEFLSTHPLYETRIEEIKRLIPEAMKYYKK